MLAAGFAAAMLALSSAEPAPQAERTYTAPGLGIAFDYAPGRRVGPCPEGPDPACVALFEGDRHLISFQTYPGALEEVAAREAGFQRNDAGVLMTTYGRFTPVAVEPFDGAGWKGLKATITCGVSDEDTGFHAAGGECLWAVVGDGRRAVVANTQGRYGLDDQTLASLTSIRFLP